MRTLLRTAAACAVAPAVLVATAAHASRAVDNEFREDAAPTAFKFTSGVYRLSGGDLALDLNLRHGSGYGNVFAGVYASPDRDVRQGRIGWDQLFEIGPARVLPAVMYGSAGYLGGAALAEIGAPWFAGAGIGRTNLKPNFNLTFDPNDAYLLSFGRRDPDGTTTLVSYIRDNRENPSQRHVHAFYRTPIAGGDRLTLDVLYKQGLVEEVMIRRWGFTLTYDWPRFFARVAYDPKVNFTPDDMWRFTVGLRF